MKVAFIVGTFPVISETFIINQIADLTDKGIEVDIYSFGKGDHVNVSERFRKYNMQSKVRYIQAPRNFIVRLFKAIPKIFKIIRMRPLLLLRIFNVRKYPRHALSLSLLYWVEPFLNQKFDLVHCHFGSVANTFLKIKDVLRLNQKIITTFYGNDVSSIFSRVSPDYYEKLKKESSLFFVMSDNMKKRIVAQGFDDEKIRVLPVSIDVNSYPYKNRQIRSDELVNIISVGRFVEKKGFDDLLRALSLVKKKNKRAFKCHIVGDGALKQKLLDLTANLDLGDVVHFDGYKPIEEIIKDFSKMHLFVQPSKTDQNGGME